jgi:hypothetical protein
MSDLAFSHERSTPVFASDSSSEYAAELLRYLRLPVTLLLAGSLIYWLLGIPTVSWRYDYRGAKSNVVRSYAVTITGRRIVYPGAVSLVFFIDGKDRITYPVTRF